MQYLDVSIKQHLRAIHGLLAHIARTANEPPSRQLQHFAAERAAALREIREPDLIASVYSDDAQARRTALCVEALQAFPSARIMLADRRLAAEYEELVLRYQDVHGGLPSHVTRSTVPYEPISADTPNTIFIASTSVVTGIYLATHGHVITWGAEAERDRRLTHIEAAEQSPADALILAALQRGPVSRQAIGPSDRRTLAKAQLMARREFYFAAAYRCIPTEPLQHLGGHHSSPVSHYRDPHRVCYCFDVVHPEDVELLHGRGYAVMDGGALDPEVLQRMARQGKTPKTGTLAAYRWIERRGATVNPDGPKARKVQMVAHPNCIPAVGMV
jgi:hypothetical protein